MGCLSIFLSLLSFSHLPIYLPYTAPASFLDSLHEPWICYGRVDKMAFLSFFTTTPVQVGRWMEGGRKKKGQPTHPPTHPLPPTDLCG